MNSTTNHRKIPFGCLIHLLVQGHKDFLLFSAVFIAEKVDGVVDNRSEGNAMADVHILLEAFLNISLRSAHFMGAAFFLIKNKTPGLGATLLNGLVIRIFRLSDVRPKEF